MPSYRGVDQKNIIRSIQGALTLFENYSPGPHTQAYIDDLKAPDASGQTKLSAIASAKTGKELAQAVNASGVSYLCARGNKILEFHALSNTDGMGLDVLKGLASWGCFSGAMTMEYNQYDGEFDAFLSQHSVKNKFNQAVSALTGSIRKIYDQGPFNGYGLVLDDLTAGKVNWGDPTVKQKCEEVLKVLEPYYELDEVLMTGIGLIQMSNLSQDKDIQGVTFQASFRAAQAVAAAFPKMEVINAKGDMIFPPSTPKEDKPFKR